MIEFSLAASLISRAMVAKHSGVLLQADPCVTTDIEF